MEDKKTPSQNITAIVLAAGESKRMGEDNKLLLSLKGRPMITHVVASVLQARVDECIVVLGHQAVAVQQALAAYPVRFVVNEAYKKGMSTSIRAGVGAAPRDANALMMCLSDMPLIDTTEYDELIKVYLDCYLKDKKAIVVPEYDGQRGNPVVMSASFKPAMLAHEGVGGCKHIVKLHPNHVYYHSMKTNHVLQDIDTPDSFATISMGK